MAERSIPPPRLYVLPARDAPVAVVLRRGPSDWFHVLRWDLEALAIGPGAWFPGTFSPRRSDVSPDGRLLGYFAFTGRPGIWDAYYAISKVPWLTALAAWRIGNTWAPGCEFLDDRTFGLGLRPDTPPDHGRLPEGMRLGRLGAYLVAGPQRSGPGSDRAPRVGAGVVNVTGHTTRFEARLSGRNRRSGTVRPRPRQEPVAGWSEGST